MSYYCRRGKGFIATEGKVLLPPRKGFIATEGRFIFVYRLVLDAKPDRVDDVVG